MLYSEELGIPRSDPKRWRLDTDEVGRTTWRYVSEEDAKLIPQHSFVKYLLGLEDFEAPQESDIKTPFEAVEKGADFLELLQDPCGSFPCLYEGPTFITIGYVVAHYYTKIAIPEAFKQELIRYIVNNSHPVDGGWGLHTADKSTCFGTTISYVCLRLLGMEALHPVCIKARKTLHTLGGAVRAPHWGKIWLAVLNLYDWDGVNPAPPELWSLPYALPIHPGRWWVHTRAIYLPVGYIQSNKVKCELDPLLEALRLEIYLPNAPYDKVNFNDQRNNVCGVDLYYPHTKTLDAANYVLSKWEKIRPGWVLKMTNKRVYDLVKKDLANTSNLSIAPISYAFSFLVTYIEEGADSVAFKNVLDRVNDPVFHGPQGMTVMGTNGSQTWDASFMVQYFMMAGLADIPKYQPMIRKAYEFLVRSQFTDECVPGSFRDRRKGGWPFSTKDQGFVVSDCTAEALKAIIMVRNHPAFPDVTKVDEQNLYDAVEVLLGLQNVGSFEFGSFASYERIKATPLLEKLNPAEVFNKIMVEYPYVECTDSSVLGLTYFHQYFPDYKSETIETTIENAIQYIVRAQDPHDGSWYGSWGVCFTYASMFALEALSTTGLSYMNSVTVKRGCDFLISKQLSDGGWSESMKSCETLTYVVSEKSLVVQTAWAVIGLILADYPHHEPIRRGIKLIMDRQLPTGEWKFESISGVFNHSCAIEYPSYKFLFTIKALGLYAKKYEHKYL
jgi:lanosterol synthase